MKITLTQTIALGVLALALIALTFYSFSFYVKTAGANSMTLPATIASSSSNVVNTTASAVFATSSCSARIISTATSSVMITFSDYANQSPNDSFGNYQPASTTVAYDSGTYGCGLVKVWSQTSQRITVTEVR